MSDTPQPIPRETFDPTAYRQKELEKQKKSEMSFVDHIDVFRKHLIRGIIATVIFTALAFAFNDILIDKILFGPTHSDFWTYQVLCNVSDALCFDLPETPLQNRKVSGQFTLHISSSLIAGIILAFPYIFFELWRFIRPALYNKEEQVTKGTVFFVSILFMMGILFGYYIIAPLTYSFFVGYSVSSQIVNNFDTSSYFSIIGSLILICGLMFELPMVSYFLAKAGLLQAETMATKRKIAIVIILFLAAVFTPPDIFSQLLIALPIVLLYELSIIIVRRVNKTQIA